MCCPRRPAAPHRPGRGPSRFESCVWTWGRQGLPTGLETSPKGGTMMWLALGLGCSLTGMGLTSGPAEPAKTPQIRSKKVVSQPYHIDGYYASMRGPYGFNDVSLWDGDSIELLWIVGYKTTVVSAESAEEMSQEFMCHANLDFEASEYYDRFPRAPSISGRLFTLSQGQQEIRFPEGWVRHSG